MRLPPPTKLLAFLLFFTTVLLSTSGPVNAQANTVALTFTPVFFDLTAKPGQTIKDRFRIRNNTGETIPLKLEVKKVVSPGENSIVLEDTTSEDQFVSWIKVDVPFFQARPREWTDVNFEIHVPEDAAFGYYWAFVLSQDLGENNPNNSTQVIPSGAVPVLLNVLSPGAVAEAKLVEFKAGSFINEYLPVDFAVKVANQGNVHIKPRGNIFIRSSAKDLAILEVNQDLGNILPLATRVFDASWDDGFLVRKPVVEEGKVKLDKNGKAVTHLSINWNRLTHFRIGRYKADVLLVYDNGERDVVLEGTTAFWVFPYKFVGGFLLILLLVVLILRTLLRSYVRKEARKYRR